VIVRTLTGVSIELLVLESWLELTGTQAPPNWAILDQGNDAPRRHRLKTSCLATAKKITRGAPPEVSDGLGIAPN